MQQLVCYTETLRRLESHFGFKHNAKQYYPALRCNRQYTAVLILFWEACGGRFRFLVWKPDTLIPLLMKIQRDLVTIS